MKKILLLLCTILFVCGCGMQPVPAPVPSPAKDWSISISFNYNFANYVPCSSTVTTGCITGFTWGYLNGSTPVTLKTSPASICSGTTQPETCLDTTMSTLGIGAVTFYVQANGVNNTGATVASTPADAATPVNIAIGNATNVSGSAQ